MFYKYRIIYIKDQIKIKAEGIEDTILNVLEKYNAYNILELDLMEVK